ncbi:hypothetical protein K466DRAFT_499985, partial [Polyporus arcularius HHB13444]
LFEFSPESGDAGFYQWGLDAGHHQDGWEPFNLLDSRWFTADYPENAEELLEASLLQLIQPLRRYLL